MTLLWIIEKEQNVYCHVCGWRWQLYAKCIHNKQRMNNLMTTLYFSLVLKKLNHKLLGQSVFAPTLSIQHDRRQMWQTSQTNVANCPAGGQRGIERCYIMSGHYLQVVCMKLQCKVDFVRDRIVQSAISGHFSEESIRHARVTITFSKCVLCCYRLYKIAGVSDSYWLRYWYSKLGKL